MPQYLPLKCFTCDLSPKCKDCKYYLGKGYAYSWVCGVEVKRTNESWNHNHPNDLMPEKGYEVHHVNENKLDDSEINLKKWAVKKHRQFHMNGKQHSLGCKHTEESKENQHNRMKGNQNSLGFKHTKETNKKNSERMKGNKNAKGYKHTEEQKEKNRQAKLGNQCGRGNKGKKLSEETKEKMRIAKKGRKLPLRTEEYCKKQSESQKKYWEDVRSGKRVRKKVAA